MPSAPQLLASALSAMLLLGACASKDPKLLNLRKTSSGPDEFSILPNKSLEMPLSLATLLVPTPGGGNLTDPTPNRDAILALGGSVKAVGKADLALNSLVARVGSDANIRNLMAADDAEFRKKNKGLMLEQLFSVNTYFRAYEAMSLDQYSELSRWRALGLANVSAPPEKQSILR